MNLHKAVSKIKDISALMSSNYLTDEELLNFYTSKFKPSDLHSVEVSSFDEVQDVSLKNFKNIQIILTKDSIFGAKIYKNINILV
jgi:hypothetical protein